VSQATFKKLLQDLIAAAVESGLDADDIHGELTVADMQLDDHRIDMETVDLMEELPPY